MIDVVMTLTKTQFLGKPVASAVEEDYESY